MFAHYIGKTVLFSADEGNPIPCRLTVQQDEFVLIMKGQDDKTEIVSALIPISDYTWTGTQLPNGEHTILIQHVEDANKALFADVT